MVSSRTPGRWHYDGLAGIVDDVVETAAGFSAGACKTPRPAGILYGNGPAEPLYIFNPEFSCPSSEFQAELGNIQGWDVTSVRTATSNVLPFWPDLVQST